MKLSLLILALTPAIALAIWLYIKDKYEREPLKVLGKYFLIGVLISLVVIMIEEFLVKLNIFQGYLGYAYLSFIVAAITEEGIKALSLIPNLLKEDTYNEKLDGIIYSAFLSLGFATVENIIYVFFEHSSQVVQVGLIRGVISVPTHIMFAITMGYYISKYKYEKELKKKRKYLIFSVLIPILQHGIFDFILMISNKGAIIVFMIYLLFLWKFNLDKLDKYVDIAKIRFLKDKKKTKKKNKRLRR